MWYAEKRLITHNQVAFRKNQGTMDALLHFEHHSSKIISNKGHVTCLSLDFEKAYGRIGLHKVLQQLAKWKLGPKCCNLLKIVLTNRRFRIKVHNNFSHCLPLENGVPQGSPLSVVIFIIVFNEISEILSHFFSLLLYVRRRNSDIFKTTRSE